MQGFGCSFESAWQYTVGRLYKCRIVRNFWGRKLSWLRVTSKNFLLINWTQLCPSHNTGWMDRRRKDRDAMNVHLSAFLVTTLTSIALVSILVSLNGIFSGNFSLIMATSKQSPKSMCSTRPVNRSNIKLDGCLQPTQYWNRQLKTQACTCNTI